MQDLNASDIRKYVSTKFEAHPAYQQLKLVNNEADFLLQEIVDKAQGVFLWVFLVVRSLMEGLRNADRMIDLKRRLQEFPTDLNEYFGYMLQSLDPIYKTHVAKGFQVALSAKNPLSVLQFWYLDQAEEDPEYAMKMTLSFRSHRWPGDYFVSDRSEIMAIRINGRFKGLLEVTKASGTDSGSKSLSHKSRVDFLHRTVKDFLLTTDCENLITKWMPSEYDVDLSVAYALLADLKEIQGSQLNDRRDTLVSLMEDLFYSLSRHEVKAGYIAKAFHHELHKVLNEPVPTSHQSPKKVDSTAKATRPSYLWETCRRNGYEDLSYREWAISYDASGFLATIAPNLVSNTTSEKMLLHVTTAITFGSVRVLQYLFDLGIKVSLESSWCKCLLDQCGSDHNNITKDECFFTLKMLFRNGVFQKDLIQPMVYYLEKNFSQEDVAHLLELLPQEKRKRDAIKGWLKR